MNGGNRKGIFAFVPFRHFLEIFLSFVAYRPLTLEEAVTSLLPQKFLFVVRCEVVLTDLLDTRPVLKFCHFHPPCSNLPGGCRNSLPLGQSSTEHFSSHMFNIKF